MPNYPVKRYRKRNYRKKPSRYQVYSKAGSQLYKDVSMLKNLINVEFKFFDNNTSAQVLSSTMFLQSLNNMVEGDTDETRDGAQIRMKSIQCDGTLVRGSVDANVKLFWIMDLQPMTGTPTYAQIYNTVAGDATVGCRNLDNRARFIILKEKTYFCTTDNPNRIINYYRKIDAKVVFSGNTASYTDIRKNALIFVAISNVAVNGPVLNCKNRIRYIDN